jgi:hypothetical protein
MARECEGLFLRGDFCELEEVELPNGKGFIDNERVR